MRCLVLKIRGKRKLAINNIKIWKSTCVTIVFLENFRGHNFFKFVSRRTFTISPIRLLATETDWICSLDGRTGVHWMFSFIAMTASKLATSVFECVQNNEGIDYIER